MCHELVDVIIRGAEQTNGIKASLLDTVVDVTKRGGDDCGGGGGVGGAIRVVTATPVAFPVVG